MADDGDDAKSPDATTRASERLSQVANQLNPNNQQQQQKRKKTRRTKSSEDSLPADYSDLTAQMTKIRHLAQTPNPSHRGYLRQKQAGKLWVRERIALLFDKDTFREVGSLSGTTTWRQTGRRTEEVVGFEANNNIQGFGELGGRRVIATVDDFSVRAGHADGATAGKTWWMEGMAVGMRVPVVKIVDGSSGGGGVTTIREKGFTYLPHTGMRFRNVIKQLDMGIPNLGAVLGPAIGLGAARVTACHFSVMAADVGALFNAGPEVVRNATFESDLHFQDLGGPAIHCRNGTIDNLAPDEAGCFAQLRAILSYLPDSGNEAPLRSTDLSDPPGRREEELRSIVPRRRGRMYSARRVIEGVVDRGSFFEIGALWGRTVVGGVARMHGWPVGVLSGDCEVGSGATDAQGAQKMVRLLRFCDVFNLPIVQFVDIPGYAIGTVAEKNATMKWGIEVAKAYYTTTTPIFSIVTRRAFGVAAGLMLECRDPMPTIGWPSMHTGSLPLEGGIEVGHRHELREAEKEGKRDERYKELEDEYERLVNPVRTANAFGIEEIVDPPETRGVVCGWVERVYGPGIMGQTNADRMGGRIRATFT